MYLPTKPLITPIIGECYQIDIELSDGYLEWNARIGLLTKIHDFSPSRNTIRYQLYNPDWSPSKFLCKRSELLPVSQEEADKLREYISILNLAD